MKRKYIQWMSGDLSVFTMGAGCQMLGAEREKPWEKLRSQEESFPPLVPVNIPGLEGYFVLKIWGALQGFSWSLNKAFITFHLI